MLIIEAICIPPNDYEIGTFLFNRRLYGRREFHPAGRRIIDANQAEFLPRDFQLIQQF